MKKLSNAEAELKKSVACKKACVFRNTPERVSQPAVIDLGPSDPDLT